MHRIFTSPTHFLWAIIREPVSFTMSDGCLNFKIAISQEWMVWLTWNKMDMNRYDVGPTIWPWSLTPPMTLTLDFQGQIFTWGQFWSLGIVVAYTMFMKIFFGSSETICLLILTLSKSSDISKKIIRHFSLRGNEKFFRRSDNMSADFEQIIRHFAKSSSMADGPMASVSCVQTSVHPCVNSSS